MPTITTLGTASARAYGLFSENSKSYWLSFLSGSTRDQAQSVLVDGNKNSYTAGYTNSDGTAGNFDWLITKYDYNGIVQWKKLLGTSTSDQANGIAISSAGELYVVGFSSSLYIQVAKYNSSGVLQWQKRTTSQNGNFQKAIGGASGSVYICGQYNNPTTTFTNGCVVKIDSSPVVQWSKLLGFGTTSSFERFNAIALDSSENVYVAGYTTNGGANSGGIGLFAKYNSSGTIQWQRTIIVGSTTTVCYGIAVASSGYLYVVGGYSGTATTPGGATSTFLAKYSTDGTYVWQRSLNSPSFEGGIGIALDSLENIYITGAHTPVLGSDKDILIAKYNSSGTIQWQRAFFGFGGDDTGTGIAIDGFENMYISSLLGFSSPSGSSGNIKLPTNGTRTGTYNDTWRYAESSLTLSSSLSNATAIPSYVDTAVTITLANSTLTANDATFITSSVIPL